ncbi:hypothetical protein PVK06_020568 [Gossypium arboreum]|uniref:Transposase MuDR plant domain-containing protein n=1 Tax=Gossypium arboreum TaxID=29729 RepID=A0ABR0PMQ1_GOSAR|nr:hypothetical protein PVK06_020568 [Gossypium arboreum]
MFRHNRGQRWVDAAMIVVINGLCNNNNCHRLERSIPLLHYNSRSLLETPLVSTTSYTWSLANANGSGLSLITVAANTGTKTETESPITLLCSGFSGLLQSGYYDVPEISMGADEAGTLGSNDDALDDASDPNMGFKVYEPLPNMTNIDQSIEGGLEFSRLQHRTPGHASTYRDLQVLEVRTEYPNKNVFLTAMKQYNFKNDVNYYVTKSHFEKFEAKCAMKDERCKWKIMASCFLIGSRRMLSR